jgi:hypothetical protein
VPATVSAVFNIPVSSFGGVVARYAGPGDANTYVGTVERLGDGSYVAKILKSTGGGAMTQIGSTFTLPAFAGLVALNANAGSTLTLSIDGIDRIAVIDTSIAGPGTVGIRAGLNTTVDNFSAN